MIYLINIKIHIITFVDVKSSTYINSSGKVNNKDPKFKISDIVRISKYKNIFAKDFVDNWSEKVFVIAKVKNTVLWTYVTSDTKGERIVRTVLKKKKKKNCKKQIKKV